LPPTKSSSPMIRPVCSSKHSFPAIASKTFRISNNNSFHLLLTIRIRSTTCHYRRRLDTPGQPPPGRKRSPPHNRRGLRPTVRRRLPLPRGHSNHELSRRLQIHISSCNQALGTTHFDGPEMLTGRLLFVAGEGVSGGFLELETPFVWLNE
jgi:hypothetical protein